jgi:hydrophobic/amphiphilic exporter-1 (mainly G- bacteria), HAE1 family
LCFAGLPAQGVSSGQALTLMEEIARRTLPAGTGFEWSAMSYQEKLVGNQMYIVFALALLLVYLVLAGQYESWYAPISVILSVPLSFIGPVVALSALTESGLNNNLYVQIGLVLLMALSAKNAILIVEFARELRAAGKPILDAATEAARSRFRPIVMTSLAFILGVVPLVLASGAGARVSIGVTMFTGMIASTCLAVLFVPPFFAVVQRFEEWRKGHKGLSPAGTPAE